MPTAVVYNEFLRELGGGERSTLAYAKALRDLGYDTDVVATSDIPSRSELLEHFGDEFASIPVRRIGHAELKRLTHVGAPAVFVNHTFMSFFPNPAAIGIYAQMFPARVLREPQDRLKIDAISTYDLILSNSEFTQHYTQARWPVARGRLAVLRPPIGRVHVAQGEQTAPPLSHKVKQFLSIGRFNPTMHTKNQPLIIDTFLEAAERNPALRDWRLVLVGTVGPHAHERSYFARCVSLAGSSNGRVTVKGNVSSMEITALLSRSFGYVHATGAFLEPEIAPERCEHFGLAIVEAMAHGCLAAAYHRGGIWEIVGDSPGIRQFASRTELIDSYGAIAELYGTQRGGSDARQNAAQAAQLGFDGFRRELERLLMRTASGRSTVIPRERSAANGENARTQEDH